MTEPVVEECARTNRPHAYLSVWMPFYLHLFFSNRPAFKLNITRVCVLSVLLNIRVHVRTRTAEESNTAFT